jgi:hypothetical protein
MYVECSDYPGVYSSSSLPSIQFPKEVGGSGCSDMSGMKESRDNDDNDDSEDSDGSGGESEEEEEEEEGSLSPTATTATATTATATTATAVVMDESKDEAYLIDLITRGNAACLPWQIYREIVLVGMERLLDSEERRGSS